MSIYIEITDRVLREVLTVMKDHEDRSISQIIEDSILLGLNNYRTNSSVRTEEYDQVVEKLNRKILESPVVETRNFTSERVVEDLSESYGEPIISSDGLFEL